MARPKIAPVDREQPFLLHELFFSRTTSAGVIQSGNEVFRRVADFDSLDEMIGKPHNVVRHPDMPRAIFHLLWDYILSGKPIAAYVKNLAQNGAYYWVLALVQPIQGGFLSVRFKPSSPLFDAVKKLYDTLLSIEAEYGNEPKVRELGMQKAEQTLFLELAKLGFASYDDFMRVALATELRSRARQVRRQAGPTHKTADELSILRANCRTFEDGLESMFARVDSFLKLIDQIEAKSTFLSNLAQEISLLSLNSLISCHRMGDLGRGLAVVADRLSTATTQSMAVIGKMTEEMRELVDALRDAAFRICGGKLQVEISVVFLDELLAAGEETIGDRHREDLSILSKSIVESFEPLQGALDALKSPLSQISLMMTDLGSAVRSLSRIHLIGQVEAAHVPGADTFLQLFVEVEHQLSEAKSQLSDFPALLSSLSHGLKALEQDQRASRRHLDRCQAA